MTHPDPVMDEVEARIASEARARVAGALGLTALSLIMVAPCVCGGTLPVGGLIGLGAAIAGGRAANEEPSAAGRAWARTGLATGAAAAACTLLVLLAFGGIMLAQAIGSISAYEAVSSMVP